MVGSARIEKKEAFIKALTPNELTRYILYFKPIYTDDEVDELVRKLT